MCKSSTIRGKSYCAKHHDRVYLTLLPEMATYIIEKELKPVDVKSEPLHNSDNKGHT
jgi:hypothetical protein